ncbi:nucleic acid dioxygenase ALKBH1-like [Antedon mediterranea]|uniref:nucleic acid dioxygenase ALKBH1-like n=1 Tax=Antedon mediterranea TaxID=105859 RepID=UPI003AF49F57
MATFMSDTCDCSSPEVDLFKVDFKYYKSRKPPPKYDNCINFTFSTTNNHLVTPFKLLSPKDDLHLKLGLKTPAEWECFKHQQCPGLIFIRNPFLHGYQRYWVKQCLEEFTKKPNKTNLDGEYSSSDTFNNILGNKELCKKLRWVTLGYQYDWTNKLYYANEYVPFPPDLAELTKYLAKKLEFMNFTPEAGIVNFYHMDSTLGGHTDHSEYDMTAPLFSISFGQTAVFLIGGPTKTTKPVAMFVNSGDVIVMSGSARLAYHAVPRIIPARSELMVESFTLPGKGDFADINTTFNADGKDSCLPPKAKMAKTSAEQNSIRFKNTSSITNVKTEGTVFPSEKTKVRCEQPQEEITKSTQSLISCASKNITFNIHDEVRKLGTDISWQPFEDFLKTSRINMNVRQVLPEGKTFTNIL